MWYVSSVSQRAQHKGTTTSAGILSYPILCILCYFQTQQGIEYVQAVLLFFLTLSKIPMAAEALTINGLNQRLCLALGSLYNTEITHPVQQQTVSQVLICPCNI